MPLMRDILFAWLRQEVANGTIEYVGFDYASYGPYGYCIRNNHGHWHYTASYAPDKIITGRYENDKAPGHVIDQAVLHITDPDLFDKLRNLITVSKKETS